MSYQRLKSYFIIIIYTLSITLNASGVPGDVPTDPTKPSYQAYQADLTINKIISGKAKYVDAKTQALKLEDYFKQHPDLETKNNKGYEALRKKEIELTRAYVVGKSLSTCEGQRQLNDRIYKNVIQQPITKQMCNKTSGTSFEKISAALTPISQSLNKTQTANESNSQKTRPELIELRKQVYLEGLANGIKNQLEIGFKLEGFPHTQEMVDRVVNKLINERCTVPALCTDKDKKHIRDEAKKHANSAGFNKGKTNVSDQGVVDQFCTKFNSYPEVNIFYNLQKDEARQPTYEQKQSDPRYINRVNHDGPIASIQQKLKLDAKIDVSTGYRKAALDMMQKGGVGLLIMGGKSGQEFKVPFDCKNPKDPRNIEALKKARFNLREGLKEHAKKLSAMADPAVKSNVSVKKQLADMIKANPGAFAQVIAQNPNLAVSTCDVISEVEKQDIRKQNIDRALMIGGMVVAGALVATGVGALWVAAAGQIVVGAVTVSAAVVATSATAVGWAGAGVAAVGGLNNLRRYYEYDEESKNQIGAVLSTGETFGNGDRKTYDEAAENKKKSQQALSDAKMSGVEVVLSPVGGKAVGGIAQLGKTRQVSAMTNAEKYLDFSAKMKNASSSELALLKKQQSAMNQYRARTKTELNLTDKEFDALVKEENIYNTHMKGSVIKKANGELTPDFEKTKAIREFNLPVADKFLANQGLTRATATKAQIKEAERQAAKLSEILTNKDVLILGTVKNEESSLAKIKAFEYKSTKAVLAEVTEQGEVSVSKLQAKTDAFLDEYQAMQKSIKDLPRAESEAILEKYDAQLYDYKNMLSNRLPKDNRIGDGDAQMKKLLGDRGIVEGRSGSFRYTAPVEAAPVADAKTLEEKYKKVREYEKTFNSPQLESQSKEIFHAPPSAQKKLLLDKNISENEAALKELQDIKTQYGKDFSNSNIKGVNNTNILVDKRMEVIQGHLKVLKNEEKSLTSSIQQLNRALDEVPTSYQLESKLEYLKGNQLSPNSLIRETEDRIIALKNMQKNFTAKEIPKFKEVNPGAEAKRLQKFLDDLKKAKK